MPRISSAEHALKSALGNLWTLDELAEEAQRFEGDSVARAVWHRNAADAQRWIRIATATGHGDRLPPSLLRNAAYWRGQGWPIPETKERSDKWQS